MVEMVNVAKHEAARRWMLLGLSIPMLVRGIDRIHDSHPLSGWLMAASGVLMLVGAWPWWRTRGRS